MKSITAEKDIGHPLVTIITVPYSKETLNYLIKHFMALRGEGGGPSKLSFRDNF